MGTGAVLFMFFPLVFVFVTPFVAILAGCTVNEGSPSPCDIFGFEAGSLLYAMGVLPWLIFYTVPIGVAVLFVTLLLSTFVNRKPKA